MEKPMIRNVFKTFGYVRVALAAVVGVPFLIAASAFAQNPAPPPPPPGVAAAPAPGQAEVERVIVTGSNIPTAEEVGPNPVFTLNRDLINKSGQGTTTEQLLKSQPVMNASSVPVQNNGTSQAGPSGSASVSLRGFDPGATLLLIDGRRVAPFPGAANSAAGFVDLLTVPVSAVQSIEILKDGASTTYGADAVAGVVNMKLYKDYRGAQVSIQYGNTLDKDAGEYLGSVLFGVGDDKMSITGDIFFYHHNAMFNKDRGNSAIPPFLSSNTTPWQLAVSSDVAAAAGGKNLNPGGREFATPPTGSNGLSPVSTFVFDEDDRPRGFESGSEHDNLPGFNFNAFSSSWPDQERWGGYAAFNDKICDDQLQIYGDFYYVDAKTHDELAPEATNNFEVPGQFSIFIPPGPLPLPVVNGVTVTPPATPTAAEVGMPNGAFNPFNPFEQIISGGSRARFLDFGNRIIDNESIAERFTTGVKGDKLFDGSWGYDGAFMYSQIEQISRFVSTNFSRFERIMNGNDSLFNPSSGDFIGQTTPYNPFSDQLATVTPSNLALISFARARTRDLLTSKLATLDLNIYTTDLFDLPAGGVGLALGGNFSRDSYIIDPDDQNRLAELGGTKVPETHAGRKTYSFYAETVIPIFSPAMGIWGLHNVEVSAGVRYEAWLNNDTNALVPKVGLRWQPFDEQLTIRSTWGEGFLEPSMAALYGPQRSLLGPAHFTGFAPVAVFGPAGSAGNPFQDVADVETTIQQQPNSHLAPEHDRTWTGGIVYTPKWIPPQWGTATLSVDLWDIERTGVVMFRSPQSIVAGYNAGIFPGVISPATPSQTQPAVLFDPAGGYGGVSTPYVDGGRENARGVDLGFQYQLETGIGTWTWLTRVSYLDQFIFQFPGDRARQVAGRSNADWFAGSFFGDTTTGDAWFKWKGITNLDWAWHNFDLNATVHMVDGYWEQIYSKQFDGFWKQHYVHPTWFTDAQASYSLIFTPPVEAQPVAGYSKGGKEVIRGKEGKAVESAAAYAMPCWQTILNNSTFTVGVNNIFGEDPPAAFGVDFSNSIGYPGSTYDNLGRFVYVRLVKKF